jgi:aminopeptidase N
MNEFGYEYPWAKYDQITIPGIGGGAESTSATVLGHVTIHDVRAEQDFSSVPLVAHEAAHQWWGDLVTMRSWSDTWINEGFASYSEYLFALHAAGKDEAAINLLNKKQSYLKEAREKYMRPIVFDVTGFQTTCSIATVTRRALSCLTCSDS